MSQLSPTTETSRRILIACIGNIFFGDDGFGVEVARLLLNRSVRYPEGVEIVDFGIRGYELAYTLLEDYDTLVLVDTVSRGKTPGTLYIIEPDITGLNMEQGTTANMAALDSHSMDPLKVLAFARMLGAHPQHIFLVGCEPAKMGTGTDGDEMQMGLTQPVQLALDGAVKMIDSLIEKLLTSDL